MNTTYESGKGSGSMTSAMIRPAWTPVTIVLMIVGFMIFWPLGLAMLAFILWGDRLEEFKSGLNKKTDEFTAWTGRTERSGNVAFDEWRESEIERLREERRKLDEMRAEFEEHLRELRRARDREEFDAFMKNYNQVKRGEKD